MSLIHAASFWVLAFVSLVRLPVALADPKSQLSWWASSAGALAMFTFGAVIPQEAMDALMGGGRNYLNLAQNLLATIAFWFMLQAVIQSQVNDGASSLRTQPERVFILSWRVIRFRLRRLRRGLVRQVPITRWIWLGVILVAFAGPFFLVRDKGPTSFHVIIERIDQPAMWLYASVYMAAVAYFASMMLWHLHPRHSVPHWIMKLGAGVVLLACVDEVASLTLDHLDAPLPELRELLYSAFNVIFYPGVLMIAAGMIAFGITRGARSKLHNAVARYLAKRSVPAQDDAADLTQVVMFIGDQITREPRSVRLHHRAVYKFGSWLLERQLRKEAILTIESEYATGAGN